MKIYSATIRLGGFHEVLKLRLTAPEVEVLRELHGPDNVVGLACVGDDNVVNKAERKRLSELYGDEVVAKLWPGLAAKLPVSVEETAGDEVEPEALV